MKKLIQSILLIASIILISGCETKNLPIGLSKPKVNENLPIVDAATIKTIPDMTSIAIEWKAITIPEVKGYYIYRSDIQKDGQKLQRVATIDSKYTSHHLDKKLESGTQYIYAISTVGLHDFESIASQSISANTKKRFESVSFISAINELPRQIKILWRPHSNERVAKYLIQRRTNETSKWKTIKSIKSRLEVEYIDTKLKDNESFSYRIIAVTFDDIESLPSQIVKAKTKSLPNSVIDIKATIDQPQKIIVSWTTPEDISDIAYYYIYSSDNQNKYFTKLIKARADTNTYDHLIPSNGKMKFYKITTVDKDELESSKNMAAVLGKTLNEPSRPIVTLAQIQDDQVILNWKPSDSRAVSYNIYKSIKEGMFSKKTVVINNITDVRFEDKDIVRGVTYEYSIEAIDEFGLLSKKTPPTALTIPKLPEVENATPSSN